MDNKEFIATEWKKYKFSATSIPISILPPVDKGAIKVKYSKLSYIATSSYTH